MRPTASPRRVCARAGRGGTGRGGRGRGGVSRDRDTGPGSSCLPSPPPLPHTKAPSPPRSAHWPARPSRASVPAAPPAKVSSTRCSRAAPAPPPGRDPARGEAPHRLPQRRGPLGARSSAPWATPRRDRQRPCRDPRGVEEGRSSSIPGPPCPRLGPLRSPPFPSISPHSHFPAFPLVTRAIRPVLAGICARSGCRLTSVQMCAASSELDCPAAGRSLPKGHCSVPRPDVSGWDSCCLSARQKRRRSICFLYKPG